MSTILKACAGLAALSLLGGCLLPNPQAEEIVIVEPAPVVAEPVGGKYD
ncbi:hypothetical protein [Jannaschia seohaensis]|uniref:Lipoprotein n=1 Tax=Jannaschia seohaensis TaxID=475081 RepID=A0A2Y9AXY6_9RHOB|nr:hypothetical protein [Jannaschia seohaensis]PWJ16920.1 hypothetical protein BCF38_10732 [Jannaschia seohaensis]SSA48128.1 hypothetical protein SAMN05421539_10732 [Jannaschia seohaensis]